MYIIAPVLEIHQSNRSSLALGAQQSALYSSGVLAEDDSVLFVDLFWIQHNIL